MLIFLKEKWKSFFLTCNTKKSHGYLSKTLRDVIYNIALHKMKMHLFITQNTTYFVALKFGTNKIFTLPKIFPNSGVWKLKDAPVTAHPIFKIVP